LLAEQEARRQVELVLFGLAAEAEEDLLQLLGLAAAEAEAEVEPVVQPQPGAVELLAAALVLRAALEAQAVQ
jgi:hypothetical protein